MDGVLVSLLRERLQAAKDRALEYSIICGSFLESIVGRWNALASRLHMHLHPHHFPICEELMLLPDAPRGSPPQEHSFGSKSHTLFLLILILVFKINHIGRRGAAWSSLLLAYEPLYL